MDNRQPWEIARDIRIRFADTFRKYLTIEGHDRTMLEAAYRCDDLHQWARERIEMILARTEMSL